MWLIIVRRSSLDVPQVHIEDLEGFTLWNAYRLAARNLAIRFRSGPGPNEQFQAGLLLRTLDR
jgi:hypothetical protein